MRAGTVGVRVRRGKCTREIAQILRPASRGGWQNLIETRPLCGKPGDVRLAGMMRPAVHRCALAVALALAVTTASGQTPTYPDPTQRVLTHREQAPLVKGWIQKRFDTLLPQLMTRTGIDMWIIVSREYNDDPVFRSMAPITTYSSRRRTILVFYNPGPGKPVERLECASVA